MHAGRRQTTFSPTSPLNPLNPTLGLILKLYISVSFALTKKPRNLPEEEQNKSCVLRIKGVSRLAAQCRVKVDFFFFKLKTFPSPTGRREKREGQGGGGEEDPEGQRSTVGKEELPPE